jgi:integral membrane sensor domain MASE1
VDKIHGVKRSAFSTALAVLVPTVALAQENAAPAPVPTESSLWWMWIALALLLVGAMVALFVTQEPRSRAAQRDRARRIIHDQGPHTVER